MLASPLQTMWSFGTWIGTNYGCADYRAGKGSLMNGYLVDCTYLRHYRTQGLELSALMLEAAAHNPALFGAGSAFARDTLAPVVAAVLRFFYEHYEVNLAGEMVMRAQALETWQECTNPTTDIAGLQWVVHKVLELPDGLIPARDHDMIRALKAQLLPVTKVIRVDAPVTGGAKRQRQMRYLSHCQVCCEPTFARS